MTRVVEWMKSLWPTQDALAGNRWLAWLGPRLFHPHLWKPRRKSLAAGLAIGVFFGFLIPLAQIPASAVVVTLLRANLPAAMVSTLVTNPVTFGPVYFVAYQVGQVLVGPPVEVLAHPETVSNDQPAPVSEPSWWSDSWAYLTGVGKPLAVGLAVFAVLGAALVYFVANFVWVVRVRRRRKLRLQANRPLR